MATTLPPFGREKRRHPRVPIEIHLDLYASGSVVSRGKGKIKNISLSGMAVETQAIFHIHDHLILRFELEKGIIFDFEGQIVRKVSFPYHLEYGVEFSRVGFFPKLKLRKFILARLKKR